MRNETSDKIIEYIRVKGQTTAKDLADHFDISRQGLFKHLTKLLKNEKICKIGKPPKVFYSVAEQKKQNTNKVEELDKISKKNIEENFTIITPSGGRKNGIDGFTFWCQKTNQPFKKTAKEYLDSCNKYNAFKKDGLIDGMLKMQSTFKEVHLDEIFYLEFYSIERFGKTKLGQSLLYAKQSQNRILIKELILGIKPKIERLIKKYRIDSVGFIPPTVKREIQFMRELEKKLDLDLKKISLIKAKTEISVPQKTLNRLADRMENAQKTIIVDENKMSKNILLIDDAVGSGATLNETAGQIKSKGLCKGKIIGLAITGSFKGFDIISEV
ncbi:MAG: hypothetical protein WC897_01330 [Candidatus Gracilibacteria bacterium]